MQGSRRSSQEGINTLGSTPRKSEASKQGPCNLRKRLGGTQGSTMGNAISNVAPQRLPSGRLQTEAAQGGPSISTDIR